MTSQLVATRSLAKRLLRHSRDNVPAMAPIFRAAVAGQIVAYLAEPDGPAPLAEIDALGKPALVIIMDGMPPTGPAAWPGLPELLGWAASTFPAGQTMPRAAYDVLVEEVIAHRRFVWVDTSTELLPAWTRALGRRPEGLEALPNHPGPGCVSAK